MSCYNMAADVTAASDTENTTRVNYNILALVLASGCGRSCLCELLLCIWIRGNYSTTQHQKAGQLAQARVHQFNGPSQRLKKYFAAFKV